MRHKLQRILSKIKVGKINYGTTLPNEEAKQEEIKPYNFYMI